MFGNKPTSTFNLPDFRGAFLRDIGINSETMGVQQGDAIRNITGTSTGSVFYSDSTTGCFTRGGSRGTIPGPNTGQIYYANFSFDASRVVPTAAENRPVNYAINWFITY